MTLAPETRLGPYQIIAPIGAGGMGEVYRAKDTRLDREVAIKVLPHELSMNAEVRARFEREAKAVSSLNHPHICTLYDVGEQDGVDYIVMELLDGETLAARLTKGALPTVEMLKVASQIADALDRAHRQGLIHRDLKPGNVMLTKGGAKLLDFGLARATGMVGPTGSGVSVLTQSPTVAHPLTAEGSLVGTFQYMSPEQLEGREADARSDIFGFGAMLYEMATGRRAFEAKSQASLIAAILEREPAPVSQIAPMSPPALDRVVKQCLAKEPDDRYQSAHDLKLQLEWIAEGGSQAGVPAPVAARRRSHARLLVGVAVVAVAAAAAFAVGYFGRTPPKPMPVRFVIRPSGALTFIDAPRISPDGRYLAYSATDSTGATRIWLRPLGSLEAYPLAGTEGASRPFWSPDGRELAFYAGAKLKRVPASGGAVQVICEQAGGADGTWSRDGQILFDASITDSIRRVPASGGVPQPVASLDRSRGETGQVWPYFLPDGRHFLYLSFGAQITENALCVGDVKTGKTKMLGAASSRAEFAAPDLVLWQRGGTLLAQRLDLGKLELIGDPFPVADGLSGAIQTNAWFSCAPAGILVYRPNEGGLGGSSVLRWFDRSGKILGDAAPHADYANVALSPDGHRVAMSVQDPASGTEDLWVRDLERGVSSKLTFDPADESWPTWTPDGVRITFTSNRSGRFAIFEKDANGTGAADSLLGAPDAHYAPYGWTPDGKTLLDGRYQGGNWDLLAWERGGTGSRELLVSPFNEVRGQLSPDGNWIAYRSNETGLNEIYVRPFTGTGGKWQISTGGGTEPVWRGDGRELYFVTSDGELRAVPITTIGGFSAGTPRTLFTVNLASIGYSVRRYAVSRDGQRFLCIVPTGQTSLPSTAVVMNWQAELTR